ncbi:MAG: T9SS type A sorting domain-containing protein, partial [Bacteroidota bacterium]
AYLDLIPGGPTEGVFIAGFDQAFAEPTLFKTPLDFDHCRNRQPDYGDHSEFSPEDPQGVNRRELHVNQSALSLTATATFDTTLVCERTVFPRGGVGESGSELASPWAAGLDLQVYPNPAVGQVSVSWVADAQQETHLRVIALTGAVVQEFRVAPVTAQWQLQDLPSGWYRVQIQQGAHSQSQLLRIH